MPLHPQPWALKKKKRLLSCWKLWVCKTTQRNHEQTCSDTFLFACVSSTLRSLRFYMKKSLVIWERTETSLPASRQSLRERKAEEPAWVPALALYQISPLPRQCPWSQSVLSKWKTYLWTKETKSFQQWEVVVWKGRAYSVVVLFFFFFFFCPKSKELLPNWHEYQQKSRSTLESQAWTKWIVTETLNTPKLLSEELNHCRTLSESLNLWGSFYKHAKWG